MSVKREVEKQIRVIILATTEAVFSKSQKEIFEKINTVQQAEMEIYNILEREGIK